MRSRGDARAAKFRDDRRARGHERRAVLLGAASGEFQLHRAPLADLLAQLRRPSRRCTISRWARRDGNRWGPAISILETTSQTPYFFNFHRRQVGNFTVTGPTGSGKTVGLGFLLCQAMRVHPRPRVAFFDKDRGADPLIRAMGGSYEVLSPGTPTGFNPLQLPGTRGGPEVSRRPDQIHGASARRLRSRRAANQDRRGRRRTDFRRSDAGAAFRRCDATAARLRAFGAGGFGRRASKCGRKRAAGCSTIEWTPGRRRTAFSVST